MSKAKQLLRKPKLDPLPPESVAKQSGCDSDTTKTLKSYTSFKDFLEKEHPNPENIDHLLDVKSACCNTSSSNKMSFKSNPHPAGTSSLVPVPGIPARTVQLNVPHSQHTQQGCGSYAYPMREPRRQHPLLAAMATAAAGGGAASSAPPHTHHHTAVSPQMEIAPDSYSPSGIGGGGEDSLPPSAPMPSMHHSAIQFSSTPLGTRAAKPMAAVQHESGRVGGGGARGEQHTSELTDSQFGLEQILENLSTLSKLPLNDVKRTFYSSNNFEKICRLLYKENFSKHASNVAANSNVTQTSNMNIVDLYSEHKDELPTLAQKLPFKQSLIELAGLIRSEIAASLGKSTKELACTFKPLPRFSKWSETANRPTEIVIYEAKKNEELERLKVFENELQMNKDRFSRMSDRRRENESVEDDSGGKTAKQISPAEVSLLECLLSGGTHLCLKAQFITAVPPHHVLQSVLEKLTFLDVSYNFVSVLPSHLLKMSQLTWLDCSNNPIQTIPYEISQLTALTTFKAAFCKIRFVPDELFAIEALRHVDLAFNIIERVPRSLGHSQHLEYLNLTGNQICFMPSTFLMIIRQLKYFAIDKNFIEPNYWPELEQKLESFEFPKLSQLCAIACGHYGIKLPESGSLEMNLQRNDSICDLCQGPIFGTGFTFFRPFRNKTMENLEWMPILFTLCSPGCKNSVNSIR